MNDDLILSAACENSELISAAAVRPGITISFTGLDDDAAEVTEVEMTLHPVGVRITLETGRQKTLLIMDSVLRCPE